MSESQAEPEGMPSAEELVAELRKAKVSDLLVHTCSLLASLAFGKLAPDLRDLDQARLAIDALKALAPLLEEGPRRDVQQVVATSSSPTRTPPPRRSRGSGYARGMARKRRGKKNQPSGRPDVAGPTAATSSPRRPSLR